MIAALFIDPHGPYVGLPNVDSWDKDRDARLYAGPYPVVAHPPCERWGRYWSGGPSARERRGLGDDDGCFAAAIKAVRTYGGVLEHPEASHAWKTFGINRPPRAGGWVIAMDGIGSTCCVEQGHYGHPARKATWLYTVAPFLLLPNLKWGSSGTRDRIDPGFHSQAERKAATPERRLVKRLSKAQRIHTPTEFRDLLISIAEACR